MDINITNCPSCHEQVSSGSFFCPQCGKKLQDKPLSTSIGKQIFIYFVSFFLCPLGLWWAVKYLKQEDIGAKRIGIVSIILTILALVLAFLLTKEVFNIISQSVNLNLNQYQIPEF